MNKINLYILVATVLMCMASLSDAQQPSASAANLSHPDREAPGINPNHGPPPEAYSACEGKAAGTQSSFTSPRGDTVKGSCENDGSGKVVLRPDRSKSGGPAVEHRGPPPEAYTACESKTAGSRTQFTSPRGDTIVGTCEKEGEKLVLRPDRSPKNDDQGSH